jgi:hypothetical protein
LTSGGDYNEGPVYCEQKNIDAIVEAIISLANHFVKTRKAPVAVSQTSFRYIEFLERYRSEEEDWEKKLLRWKNSRTRAALWNDNIESHVQMVYFKKGSEKEKKMLARKYDDLDADVSNELIDNLEEILHLKGSNDEMYFIESELGLNIVYYFSTLDIKIFE